MMGHTIHRKLTLLGLLPAVIVGVLLTLYWTNARIVELRSGLIAKGQSYAQFIAPSLEYGIVTGNRSHLRVSARAIASDRDIVLVRIVNRDGLVLYAHDQTAAPARKGLLQDIASGFFVEERLRFMAPVHLTDPDSTRAAAPDPITPPVGQVAIYLTTRHIGVDQALVAIKGLAIIIAILVATFGVAYRTSRTISRPLESLANTVARIREGDLGARVEPTGSGEIALLEQGVNEMAGALQKSHETLRKAVADATAQLQEQIALLDANNRELEMARRQADLASHNKSRFVAWVSHEIRSPLSSIEGIIELLLHEKGLADPGQLGHWFRIMRQSVRDLQQLTEDLIDIARIESGRLGFNPVCFDLHSLIRLTCRALLRTDSQRIALRIEPEVPQYIHADPLRYKQILGNLIGNALKYAGDREIQVDVQTERDDLVVFFIRDQGMGMDEETLAHIFDPFAQGKDRARHRLPGAGLGLTITKALVEAMSGTIEVSSTPGYGSVFTVRLPIEPVEGAVVAPAENPAIVDVHALDGLRCLVADDDEANRLLCGWLINHLGGMADLVADGHEAVSRCASQAYDLVFLDIHMPRLDGIATLNAIRSRPGHARHIVAVTAESDRENLNEYRRAGFDAVVAKPLSAADLIRLVTHFGISPHGETNRAAVTNTPASVTQQAIALAGGNQALARDLLDLLRRDARAALDTLAARTIERESAARLAHKLRGGARICAIDAIESSCAAVEGALGEDEAVWRAALDHLKTVLAEFSAEMQPGCVNSPTAR